MNALPSIACVALALTIPAVSSAQSSRADCERKAQAAELNAGQRQAFIQRCMTGAPAPKGRAMTPQEIRADCERKAQAADVNAGRRQAFINQCVKVATTPKPQPKPPAAPPAAQAKPPAPPKPQAQPQPKPKPQPTAQQKMADCERKAQAAELKGAQRQAFVAKCVKS